MKRKPAPTIDSSLAQADLSASLARAKTLAASRDFAGAQLWFARVRRMAPEDQPAAVAYASFLLHSGQYAEARDIFALLAAKFDLPPLWVGLAAAAEALGHNDDAASAIGRALQSGLCSPAIAAMAQRLAARAGLPGFCGLAADLTLIAAPATNLVLRGENGKILRQKRFSPELAEIHVFHQGHELVGSPLSPATAWRIDGIVRRERRRIDGEVWHPGDATRAPHLTVLDRQGGIVARIAADELVETVGGDTPLTVLWRFAAELPPRTGDVRVVGPNGRDIGGSPLPARLRPRVPQKPPRKNPPGKVDVIIPVFRGFAETAACFDAVLRSVPAGTRIIAVDDGIPDAALRAHLIALDESGKIHRIASGADGFKNRGFSEAVNAGMDFAGRQRDVVLLNADTVPVGNWLTLLRDAAHNAADIGTATPLSNDATIFTYPRRLPEQPPSPFPDATTREEIAATTARVNKGKLVTVPTSHGFCMFIRADCRAAAGRFRADIFAQGYGEENDFCETARAAGFRHVAVPAAYVAHHGAVSFGVARHGLLARNLALLEQLHPGYRARIADFVARDPLAPARARIAAARFAAGRREQAVLYISHAKGGGTARVIRERMDAARALGMRAIMLRGEEGFATICAGETIIADLAAHLPQERVKLAKILGRENIARAEIHHFLGHDAAAIMALVADLAVPYDIFVHDWALLCPRITLTRSDGQYCGEPPVQHCASCLAEHGRTDGETLSPTGLHKRSANILAGAARIVVPHEDGAQRLARHFPSLTTPPIVRHWQDDVTLFTPRQRNRLAGKPIRVAVIGAIGQEKGYWRLLDAARDAAARGLNLEFVLAGYTPRDQELLATGRVFITSVFKADEVRAVIASIDADLAWLPSVWPETWCYALSDAWQAGLETIVFDIGAQAARVRQNGHGHVLPLSLPAPQINETLIRIAEIAIRRENSRRPNG
jgi:GT2 family glycosyltransferase